MPITPDTKRWLNRLGIAIIICMPIAASVYYQVQGCMCG